MRLPYHITLSLAPAIYLSYRFSFAISVLFFIGSVLIDVDHFLDHITINKRNFNIKIFFETYREEKQEYLLIIFHSWELLIPCLIFFYKSDYIFLFTGCLYHMIIDSLSNRIYPLGYFFIYRLSVKFRKEKILSLEKN